MPDVIEMGYGPRGRKPKGMTQTRIRNSRIILEWVIIPYINYIIEWLVKQAQKKLI